MQFRLVDRERDGVDDVVAHVEEGDLAEEDGGGEGAGGGEQVVVVDCWGGGGDG